MTAGSDGRDPSVGDVLRAVADHVPYLAAATVTAGDKWVGCAALLADPGLLVDVVRDTKSGFGTSDDAVAASLFVEAYAFRVGGAPLVAYALDLPVPDPAPTAVSVRIDKPRPSAVAYLGADLARLDAEALAHELVETHLRPFVDSVHRYFALGERNLLGNVAAACAVAFRACESSAGVDRARVRDRAGEFFDSCHAHFDGLGGFTVVTHAGREGWYWDRTSCCLWFRTSGSQLCDNCSLIDPAELRERRVAELS